MRIAYRFTDVGENTSGNSDTVVQAVVR